MSLARFVPLAILFTVMAFPVVEAQDVPKPTTRPAGENIITLDEIKPGMKGVGWTVFEGTEPVEFPLEVIDVVRNFGLGKDAILILAGGRVEKTGIISGMSGSPVYIEGRLAGAVSFGWPYAEEAICGVTPIQEMLDAHADVPRAPAGADAMNRLPEGCTDLERGYGWLKKLVTERMGDKGEPAKRPYPTTAPEAAPSSVRPQRLVCPVWYTGVSDEAAAFAQELLGPFSMLVSSGAGLSDDAPQTPLKAGDAVGMRFVGGDVDISGVGTVTVRMGNRVLALGHGMLQAGKVDIPMTAARIHTVIPSVMTSFKLGSALDEVGRFTTDTATGLSGVLGESARMTPVRFNVIPNASFSDLMTANGVARTPGSRPADGAGSFNFRVIDHYELGPRLAAIAAYGLMTRDGALPNESTLAYRVRVRVAGHDDVVFSDFAAGGSSAFEFIYDLMDALYYLTNNPFKEVHLEGIELDVAWSQGNRVARLKSLRLDKTEIEPGETVEIEVILQPWRGEDFTHTFRFTVPEDAVPGKRTLIIGDYNTELRVKVYRNIKRYVPTTIDQLLDVISEPRDRTKLHAWLLTPEVGVVMDDTELPALPSSALMIVATGRQTGVAPTFGALTVGATSLDYVLTGSQSVPVEILEKEVFP